MQFPTWVPEWVKNEYTTLKGSQNSSVVSLHEKLIKSEDTKSIWAAIEKADFNPNFSSGLLQLYAMQDTSSKLKLLLDAVGHALSGFEFYTMTKSQRKKFVKNIVDSSSKLAKASKDFAPLGNAQSASEMYFQFGMNAFSKKFVDDHFDSVSDHSRRKRFSNIALSGIDNHVEFAPDEFERIRPFLKQLCQNFVYKAVSAGLPDLLINLSESAKSFDQYPQLITKPNDVNARRLFFIRKLTEHFNQYYGRPFRAQVFAITSVYFDVEDIAEADLSRLAPV